ncbi:MAG: LpxI family protein [Roseobacter sp.]
MLALITGQGGLPARVASTLEQAPLVCALDGFAPEMLAVDITFRIEHLGTLIAELKDRDVREVCFCGAIKRPQVDPTQLDAATLPLVPVIMQALGSGDDGALRAVMAVFEQQGFRIRAAHEIAPDILAPQGVLSRATPTPAMESDVARADAVLQALSPLDVGQGCVVGAGQVWGVETIGGTDHMLRHLPTGVAQAGAIFVKAPKTGQDKRADMPTIGPDTIQAAADAGLVGVVICAGNVILLEPEETIQRANDAAIVLWSRAPV